jgi:hypothetical protein
MNLSRAISIAAIAHEHQTDKSGEPYILHPIRVMQSVSGDAERMVAVLHDVLEDNPNWTAERLSNAGFSAEVIEAVQILTRPEREPYDAYIDTVALYPLARTVKIADLRDNLAPNRIEALADHPGLVSRYIAALHRLRSMTAA